MENVIICKSCHRHIIADELESHRCSKVVDYKIDQVHGILYVYDGIDWYPVKLISPPKFQQPDKTPKDSTESKILEKCKLNQNFYT